jgi:hypothetical protein
LHKSQVDIKFLVDESIFEGVCYGVESILRQEEISKGLVDEGKEVIVDADCVAFAERLGGTAVGFDYKAKIAIVAAILTHLNQMVRLDAKAVIEINWGRGRGEVERRVIC